MKIYGFIHKLVIEITKEPELLFKLWNTLWKIFDIFDAKRLIFREIKSILRFAQCDKMKIYSHVKIISSNQLFIDL